MTNSNNKEFKIGNLSLEGPFMLAPLAGISDGPFRRLCFKEGASYACSEMVSAKGLFYGDKNTEKLLTILPGEGPVGFQLFGNEPDAMAWATEKLESRENKIIDINMGCPVPKIVKNGEGSALMKNPSLAYDVVSAVVKATKKPVTVKIRAGWDEKSINCVEIAKAIEGAGASAVCVHGRTREQYYAGKADWGAIRAVKEAVRIPVIGNGDVVDFDSAQRMFDETGCDLIMIGRGAFGNPWIFKELNAGLKGEAFEKPGLDEIKAKMLEHLDALIEEKGTYTAIREMRKHVGWYIKGVHGAAKLRGAINQLNKIEELKKAITNL